MKKILVIVLWSVFGIGLIVSMAFAGRAHAARRCEKVNITIDRKNADLFIVEEGVTRLLDEHGMNPEGKPVSMISVPALEKLLLTHPAVESCQVFMDIDGTVSIHLLQRSVIARLISISGESYYFDDRGYVMPWSEEYTAPVVMVNGYFGDTYASAYETCFDNLNKDSVATTVSELDDIWQVVKRLHSDSLLHAQIVQVYVAPDKKIELIPRVGNQVIVLGDAIDVDEKLDKLLVFYREGLARTGKWNDYSKINLEFRNQIVCTKK